ncbi:MAG: GH3 auxin-responsive promoter family protein [Spirochaetaceae bacterium]|jgi:hypothetical protein|nr:GH3 auxin-responsive promoter family protein [Spirochaetaceae bacterium]
MPENAQIPTTEQIFEMMIKKGAQVFANLEALSLDAVNISEKLLLDIVQGSADTEYGKKYGFETIKSIKDYKEKVPFSIYDDYAEYIERMNRKGERGLITNNPIVHYAVTSGSIGNPKLIPVSARTVELYSMYATSLYYAVSENYYQKNFGRPVHRGHGLCSLEIIMKHAADGLTVGCISAAATDTLKQIAPILMTNPIPILFPPTPVEQRYLRLRFGLPCRDVALLGGSFMTSFSDLFMYLEANWEMLCDDIEQGSINSSLKLPEELREQLVPYLKADPERAQELRAIFKGGFDKVLRRIWPNLDFISAIGTAGFKVYTDKMRRYAGDIPIHHQAYAASEALFAIATELEKEEYVLIPDGGFYEFIPVDSVNENETLTMDQLEAGKMYEIVVTNLSGFYRYRIGDVIKVTGFHNKTPTLAFVYRKKQMVSIAGEKTDESMITWTIEKLIKETGIDVFDYSIYPNMETSPGSYTFLIESPHSVPQDKIQEYRRIIEKKISEANPSVGAKIQSGVLSPCELYFLQPQTYYLYRDLQIMRGYSENQLKPIRVIDTPEKRNFFFALFDKESL